MTAPADLRQLIMVELELRRRQQLKDIEGGKYNESVWLDDRGVYINRETKRPYKPHHEAEQNFVFSDGPRYALAKGGEGGGKSVAGIVKTLERLRRGPVAGVMGSPDFEHFKKSLWPEFSRWCPPMALLPQHRYRLRFGWQPTAPFTLAFISGSTLMCGGFEDPGGWEGPNLSFAHFDEARRHKTPDMLKVLDGRCRITGPGDVPPQIFITTTPRKHWLYEYFGPWTETEWEDPLASFKADSLVIDLFTKDNESNLSPGFVEQRKQSLTEAEIRVLLEAAWEDVDDIERFLATMMFWDQCEEDLPALSRDEPIVVAADAATGRENTQSDCFALSVVSRHPRNDSKVAIRMTQKWQARPRQKIDFRGTDDAPGPERVVRWLCEHYNVIQFCYDPYQLVDMAQRLTQEEVVWCAPFNQGTERSKADRQFLDLIMKKNVAHTGDKMLRSHVQNADRKVDDNTSKLRIIKGRGHIDLLIASVMGAARVLELNI